MADILQRILARKHEEVALRRRYATQAQLIEQAEAFGLKRTIHADKRSA